MKPAEIAAAFGGRLLSRSTHPREWLEHERSRKAALYDAQKIGQRKRAEKARLAPGDPEGPRATQRAKLAARNRLILELRETGLGPSEITRRLSRRGFRVHRSTVSRVLSNSVHA